MKILKFSTLLLLFTAGISVVFAQQAGTTIKPGNDFYSYINVSWVQADKIPDDMPAWSGFATLGLENEKRLRASLEGLTKRTNLSAGSTDQKVGDFYASVNDTLTINKIGYELLRNFSVFGGVLIKKAHSVPVMPC